MLKVIRYVAAFVEYLVVLLSEPKMIRVPKKSQEFILTVVGNNRVAKLEYKYGQGIAIDAFNHVRIYVRLNANGRVVYVDENLLSYLNKKFGGVEAIDLLINNEVV